MSEFQPVAESLADFCDSYWLKQARIDLAKRDPLDALRDVETLQRELAAAADAAIDAAQVLILQRARFVEPAGYSPRAELGDYVRVRGFLQALKIISRESDLMGDTNYVGVFDGEQRQFAEGDIVCVLLQPAFDVYYCASPTCPGRSYRASDMAHSGPECTQ